MASEFLKKERAKLEKRLYPSLAGWEIILWTSTWIFGVVYAIYHVYLASKMFWRSLDVHDFEPGIFPASRKDVSDSEWLVFSKHHLAAIPWWTLHAFGTNFFQRFHITALPVFQTLLSFIYIYLLIGSGPLLLLIAQPLVIFLAAKFTKNAIGVWIISLSIIVFNDFGLISQLKEYAFENASWQSRYLTHVTMYWINSRCVSFCLDHFSGDVKSDDNWNLSSLLKLLSFCFYLPLCISGPLINYKDFHHGMYGGELQPWSFVRLTKMALLLVRYLFWYLVIELILHYFYFSALHYEPSLAKHLDLRTLIGLGYSMGQFFYLKYVFFYGLPRPFVLSENVEPPNHPKCVSRVHLYSDMWRFFDAGLHKFMHTYIYVPVLQLIGADKRGVMTRLFASTVCFSFVYLWHGIMPQVLIWTCLNYAGIVMESLAKAIWSNDHYRRFESILTPRGQRRLHAALSAPLFLMSIVSVQYFFMREHLGHVFLTRGFCSWPIGTPTLLFFMYCGAQTSIEVKNWEIRKQIASLGPIDDDDEDS